MAHPYMACLFLYFIRVFFFSVYYDHINTTNIYTILHGSVMKSGLYYNIFSCGIKKIQQSLKEQKCHLNCEV